MNRACAISASAVSGGSNDCWQMMRHLLHGGVVRHVTVTWRGDSASRARLTEIKATLPPGGMLVAQRSKKMPQDTILIGGAILFAFVMFALALAYADWQASSRS